MSVDRFVIRDRFSYTESIKGHKWMGESCVCVQSTCGHCADSMFSNRRCVVAIHVYILPKWRTLVSKSMAFCLQCLGMLCGCDDVRVYVGDVF